MSGTPLVPHLVSLLKWLAAPVKPAATPRWRTQTILPMTPTTIYLILHWISKRSIPLFFGEMALPHLTPPPDLPLGPLPLTINISSLDLLSDPPQPPLEPSSDPPAERPKHRHRKQATLIGRTKRPWLTPPLPSNTAWRGWGKKKKPTNRKKTKNFSKIYFGQISMRSTRKTRSMTETSVSDHSSKEFSFCDPEKNSKI